MFKVGDWVRCRKGDVHKVVFDSYALLSHPPQFVTQCKDGTFITSELIKWQPEVCEWCWFYNNKNDTPTLGQFLKTIEIKDSRYANLSYTNHIASIRYGDWKNEPRMTEEYFIFCEPFVGQLPEVACKERIQ